MKRWQHTERGVLRPWLYFRVWKTFVEPFEKLQLPLQRRRGMEDRGNRRRGHRDFAIMRIEEPHVVFIHDERDVPSQSIALRN